MMKRFLLAAAWTLISGSLAAQQFTTLSQYMLNSAYLNPAYSGTGEQYNITLLHRTQWAGYNDYQGQATASQMQLFSGFANIDNTGHTVGLLMARDKIAYQTDFLLQASYAYRVQLTRASTLSLGVRGGLDSRTIDFEKYIVHDPNDPSIPEAKQSETQPDLSLGLWYSHDAFYLGAAARSIVKPNDGTAGFNRGTAYIITGGLPLHVSNELTVTPTAQVVLSDDDPALDLSAMASYDDRVWGGLSYRHQEAASILAGIAFLEGKLRFTYAFDYVINNRKTTATTSHEISLQYRVGKRKETKGKYLLHKSNVKIGNIARDRDHDEVPDDDDACIDVPGLKKLNGCPDKDNDGIADGEDQCPDIAGTRAFNGCPDTDNDGVMDNDDACPRQAGLKALNGCPDKDKDGVADKDDDCPDVPGSAEQRGCPLSFSRESLGHVTFETGKATLESGSYRYLDDVIAILKQYPDTRIIIEGHTDSEGDDATNLELSKQRAETLRSYFIEKGIKADRITTNGYGESKPIETNDTAEGRKQNRRVEIHFMKATTQKQ
jgi:type IX secretion system PorP/SprF family membrane protein